MDARPAPGVPAVFGDTNRADGIPDHASCEGPVFEDGSLVLSASFTRFVKDAARIRARFGQELEGLVGEYLSDAFGIWECNEARWVPGCPFVLRLACIDLVARRQEESLALWLGSLDAQARVRALPASSIENRLLNEETALQWLSCRQLGRFFGLRIAAVRLGQEDEGASLSIAFEGGHLLRL